VLVPRREGTLAGFDLSQRCEVMWGRALPLDDRAADLDVVGPTGARAAKRHRTLRVQHSRAFKRARSPRAAVV